MFTGIVEEVGRVVSSTTSSSALLWDGTTGPSTTLVVTSPTGLPFTDAYIGCSIAVNGVCLTATELLGPAPNYTSAAFGIAPETIRRSNLSYLTSGSSVNLERAALHSGRNSGHVVQGHVDVCGTVHSKWVDGSSLFFRVELPKDANKYIDGLVPKGFVAIDGTSLTVCEVDREGGTFTFMLVGHTQKSVVVTAKNPGDKVNVEVDVMGKYAAAATKALLPRLEALEKEVKDLRGQLCKCVASSPSGGSAAVLSGSAVEDQRERDCRDDAEDERTTAERNNSKETRSNSGGGPLASGFEEDLRVNKDRESESSGTKTKPQKNVSWEDRRARKDM